MASYVIYCDMSADMDRDVAAAAGIGFVPMEYSLGDEMRLCDHLETRELLHTFYNGQRKGDLTKTSQITPASYVKLFSPVLASGKDVLYLSLSSGLSSTYDSACMASKELLEKYPKQIFCPVDTKSATAGIGLLCERAIRNQAKGMSLEENAKDLETATQYVQHWFFVQDLMYLKRGGRVGAATAAVGTLLNMRPVLVIDADGKLITIAKERGNKAAIKYLLRRFQETYDPTAEDPIYIIDADDVAQADALEKGVRELYPDITVRRTSLSPIIGAHTGPGMSAIVNISKLERNPK